MSRHSSSPDSPIMDLEMYPNGKLSGLRDVSIDHSEHTHQPPLCFHRAGCGAVSLTPRLLCRSIRSLAAKLRMASLAASIPALVVHPSLDGRLDGRSRPRRFGCVFVPRYGSLLQIGCLSCRPCLAASFVNPADHKPAKVLGPRLSPLGQYVLPST